MTRETQSKLLGEFYAEKKNVLKLKSEDYANEDVLSNFKTAGANCGISAEQQCLSAIATKVARLGNLLSGKIPNNESISDSILDLSNYTDLLYCLVNEEYLMTNIDNFPTNLSPKEVLEKFYKQPLNFGTIPNMPFINTEKLAEGYRKFTDRTEKPKGIIQALKEEPYEPKVGDMFEHEHFEKSLKIIRIVEDLIVMKDYSEILNFCCLSTCDFLNELKNGNLKKIN